jgi:hypothetical protein
METIIRIISWFDKTTEELIGEKNVDDIISLEKLRIIFSPQADDPLMIYSYNISEYQAEGLKKFVDIEFMFDKYIYQLDCFKKED